MPSRYKISQAPNGEDTASDGTEKIPVSGSKYMLVSTIAEYIRTLAQTLTNKTIALGSNTVSGTTAQFNTANTDGDFATLAGTETLTNKTVNLSSNTLTGTTAQFNTANSDGDFATLAGSETLTNKTLTTPTISGAITFPDNVRQTFNPGADAAGLNVGSHAGDPGTPSNGDLWYDSTANELTARINGSNVALGAGGGGSVATDTIWDAKGDLAGGTGANTAARLAVGTNGHVLTADSAESTGLKWAAVSASGLTNSSITPTTSNVTAAVGTRYFADISGLTANRNFVLPTCSAGNEIELKITVGDDTYELIIIGDTGVTIEGGSAATEWARTFLAKDSFRFIASGTDTWRVAYDGRRESYVVLQDQKSSGTNAGTFTSGSFATRTLNTEVQDDDGVCSLASNQFTLRAGTYRIKAVCPAIDVDSHRAKLYNTSDSTDTLLGNSAFASAASDVESPSIISGKFTITATKTFEIRHQCQTTKATYGLGAAFTALGLTEYYTTVELWRLG